MRFNSKTLICLMIFGCIIMSLSCVSAHELDSNVTDSPMLNLLAAGDAFSDVNDVGSAKELDMDIQSLSPGDTYNFEKDFYLNDTKDNGRFYTGIIIETDNITLNGNGHTIQGNNESIFTVLANNVKIYNLIISNTDNTRYANDLTSDFYMVSPITWKGDNGLITGCDFYSNCAVNGGAIRLIGNNMLIDNCLFINNTATRVGGALYILGLNNTINNTYIINSSSKLKNMIYLNPGASLNVEDIYTDNVDELIMFGDYTCIDADWFYHPVYINIFDKNINLYEIVFKSMTETTYIFNNTWTNEITYLDKNFKYNAEYNGTDFYINFNRLYLGFDNKIEHAKQDYVADYRKIDGDLILSKTYHFKNITSMGDIFYAIHEGKYIIENSLIAEYTFKTYWSDISDIKGISYSKVKDYLNTMGYVNADDYKDSSFLNIILPSHATYVTNSLGNIFDSLSDYTTIFVNGNDNRIVGPNKNDENNQWTGIKVSNEKINLVLRNLTISGFNHGVFIDKGSCTLINVKITDNYCNYDFEHDWGAGILNLGMCAIINCTFINNYAKYGGAIFNAGYLTIDNMTQFLNNNAYKSGKEIIYVDSAIINYNGTDYQGPEMVLTFNGTEYEVSHLSGYSEQEITNNMIFSFVASFVGGLIGGLAGGMIVGVVTGAIAGLISGTVTAVVTLSKNYNYHVSNLNTALLIVGGSMLSGIVGGIVGGAINMLYKYATAPGEQKIELINEPENVDQNSQLSDEIPEEKLDQDSQLSNEISEEERIHLSGLDDSQADQVNARLTQNKNYQDLQMKDGGLKRLKFVSSKMQLDNMPGQRFTMQPTKPVVS